MSDIERIQLFENRKIRTAWDAGCLPINLLMKGLVIIGKRRATDVADMALMFRVIESIPSKKAEPMVKDSSATRQRLA